jgi:hypothetical protein
MSISQKAAFASIVFVLTTLAHQPAFSGEVSIFVPSTAEFCSQYNDAADKRPINNFVFGYISAAAIYSDNDNMKGKTELDIRGDFARYCRGHPEDAIEKAAKWLFDTRGGSK